MKTKMLSPKMFPTRTTFVFFQNTYSGVQAALLLLLLDMIPFWMSWCIVFLLKLKCSKRETPAQNFSFSRGSRRRHGKDDDGDGDDAHSAGAESRLLGVVGGLRGRLPRRQRPALRHLPDLRHRHRCLHGRRGRRHLGRRFCKLPAC